jgi:hypothetical protein
MRTNRRHVVVKVRIFQGKDAGDKRMDADGESRAGGQDEVSVDCSGDENM